MAALPLILALYSSFSQAQDFEERVLRFPADRTVGTVFGRWADQDYRKLPWMPDFEDGWTVLGAATGDVIIPENTVVKLEVSTSDLSFLVGLAPNDIYFFDGGFQAISDEQTAYIARLSGLRALDLSDNRGTLSGKAFRALTALTNLEWINFQRAGVDGLMPDTFTHFPKLRYLAGHFRSYGDSVLADLADADELEFLCIKGATVSGEGLRHLNGNNALHGLVLDNVQMTDEDWAALESLPNLQYLDIKKNPISDEALRELGRFLRLTHLDLNKTAISDAGIAHLTSHSILEQLFLSNTHVTEACFDALATLPALQTVAFVDTAVEPVLAEAFALRLASRSESAMERQQSSNPSAPKVGIVMSHYTATGPHAISRPYGYSVQDSLDLARLLNEANFDVYAVVEPGTELLGELPGILQRNGLTSKVIDGYDQDALGSMDVLFVCTLNNARHEMLVAIEEALLRGLGLVNIGLFAGNPERIGYDECAERIMGLPDYRYTWQGQVESTCPVLQAHPILGELRSGDTIELKPLDGHRSDSGFPRDATVLVGPPSEYPESFPVLYLRNHGKGRVVRGQWHRVHQPGIPFPGFSFYVRCINWAAGHDPDRLW